jgi:DNA-binding SARP family transcriptional activator
VPLPIRIELLGGVRVLCNGRVAVRMHTARPAALLAYLALADGKELPREEVMEALWPEVDLASGRNRLKQTLSVLRRQLEEGSPGLDEIIVSAHEVLRLDGERASVDTGEFVQGLRRADRASTPAERLDHIDSAFSLYRGDLLPGYYDDWAEKERARLSVLACRACGELVAARESTGELTAALELALRAVQMDSLQEPAHCALIRLYALLGWRSDAHRQYQELVRMLRVELGADPSPATQALRDRIDSLAGATSVTRTGIPEKRSPGRPFSPDEIETVGGAVPLKSRFYIVRDADRRFEAAVGRLDSIVLVKGPRQVGKTSLLARSMEMARGMGARVVSLDLQKLNESQLTSIETFHRACIQTLVDQLDLDVSPDQVWDSGRGANDNIERFVRRVALAASESPLLWAIDETDRLFSYPFCTEVFSLFRSWHNERSLNPHGPWSRLTLAIAYATEAHLVISDLNQSPFNVGTRITLEDFTLSEVGELNRRYGSPLANIGELARLFDLLGGCPYLVRRGLNELASPSDAHDALVPTPRGLDALESEAAKEDGPFRDHLQRVAMLVSQDAELEQGMLAVLRGEGCTSAEAFYRLRAAGIITGPSPAECRPRCALYRSYLDSHLPHRSPPRKNLP